MDDRRGYVTVSGEDDSDNDESVDIPVTITFTDEWFRNFEEFNRVQFPR